MPVNAGLPPSARSTGKTLLIESCKKRGGEHLALRHRLVPVPAIASDFLAAPRPGADAASGPRSRASVHTGRWIALGAAMAALVVQILRPANVDVSWLLTVNERILAGATPYQDVIELNPPASILLYRLPAFVAKLLSVRSEWVLIGMFALMIGAVMAFVANILSRYCLRADSSDKLFLIVAALVVAVLPFDEMAQREHFATLFILPYAIIAIARAAGKEVRLVDGLTAGVMLGLCITIKPHFVLCALLVAGLDIARTRDVRRVFRIEYGAAGAVALAYFIDSLVFYPKFFSDVLPEVADLYLPLRIDSFDLVARAAISIAVPLCACWIARNRRDNVGTSVLLLTAMGFLGAYLIQGKGWSYHLYPAVAFFIMAAGWTLETSENQINGVPRPIGFLLIAMALILPAPRFFRADVSHPGLAAAIERLAPHPRILAIGFLQNLGHPLTRDVGGVWVGSTWGLWATGGAMLMKARVEDDPVLQAKAEAYFEKDRRMVADDIETRHPDIILLEETVGFDFGQWIAGSSRLQAALARYRLVDTVGDVKIFSSHGAPG